MGMTKRNARSEPGKRTAVIWRIAPLKLALGALALLLVSSVLAQSGGYTLDPWVVADGGAISSGGESYVLGSTVGQAGAGTVNGGSYTLYGGFWKPGSVIKAPPSKLPIYVPVILQSPPLPTPIPTPVPPLCNDIEDNDFPDQAKPLTTIGTTCIGSFQDDPQGEDDYYSIDLAAGQTISIDLTGIPADADYHLALYNAKSVLIAPLNGDQHHLVYRSAAAGHYIIRVYMARKSTATTNTYRLRAVIT